MNRLVGFVVIQHGIVIRTGESTQSLLNKTIDEVKQILPDSCGLQRRRVSSFTHTCIDGGQWRFCDACQEAEDPNAPATYLIQHLSLEEDFERHEGDFERFNKKPRGLQDFKWP